MNWNRFDSFNGFPYYGSPDPYYLMPDPFYPPPLPYYQNWAPPIQHYLPPIKQQIANQVKLNPQNCYLQKNQAKKQTQIPKKQPKIQENAITLVKHEQPKEFEGQQISQQPEQQQNIQITLINLTRQDLQALPVSRIKNIWKEEQDKKLCQLVCDNLSWENIAKQMNKTYKMCYSRYRRIRMGIKNYWTNEQEQFVKKMVDKHGKKWELISHQMKGRSAKQIRERYINFLQKKIEDKQWTIEQDLKLIELTNQFGQKWKKISQNFEQRTQNQLKNRFFSRILKAWKNKLRKQKTNKR